MLGGGTIAQGDFLNNLHESRLTLDYESHEIDGAGGVVRETFWAMKTTPGTAPAPPFRTMDHGSVGSELVGVALPQLLDGMGKSSRRQLRAELVHVGGLEVVEVHGHVPLELRELRGERRWGEVE